MNTAAGAVIGSGGQGVVRMDHRVVAGVKRLVAVKSFDLKPKDKMTDKDWAAIQKELEQVKRIRDIPHENIVEIIDIEGEGTSDVRIVMSRCPRSLDDVIFDPQYQYNPDRALRYLHQITAGLAHLHENGVVHRDIKPKNILLDNDDIVKLCDFGIARTLEHTVSKVTRDIGTYRFMPPEWLDPDKKVDNRMDIWSLGVVLWMMCTGQQPYGSLQDGQIIFNVGSGKLRPDLTRVTDDRMRSIIDWCCQHDRTQRPHAQQLIEHLQQFPFIRFMLFIKDIEQTLMRMSGFERKHNIKSIIPKCDYCQKWHPVCCIVEQIIANTQTSTEQLESYKVEWARLLSLWSTSEIPAHLIYRLQNGRSSAPTPSDAKCDCNYSTSCIHKAAEDGDIESVDRFLQQQPQSVNYKNKDDWTPLIYASYNGHVQIVRRLLEAGADVHARDSWGLTALMLSAWSDSTAEQQHNQCSNICALLLAGADVNSVDEDGCSALHDAAWNRPIVLQHLINHGADVTIKRRGGVTALDWARRNRNNKCIEILEKAVK